MTHTSRRRSDVWLLGLTYLAIVTAVTWPLATRLTTSVAGDYGDSLFVTWVVAWVDRHLIALLHGDLGAWAAMWQAPIFAPEPDTLTYSDHFLAQAVQALPIYWVSGNPLLAYNLVFVATMALTGLAVHRLTYSWTNSHVGGAVAGLTAMLNDYRWTALGHLQTLSVQWWIFALWGLDHFAATGSRWALAGATASLVLLHLSSAYLMAFCAPFTAAFAIWALARHGKLRDGRAWGALVAAGLVSIVAVLPVLLRYLATQEALGVTRSLREVVALSAPLEAYGVALPWLGPLAALAALGAITPPLRPGQPSRRAKFGLVALILIAAVLALGPVVHIGGRTITGPYAWLMDHIPGFTGLRVPHRYAVVLLSLLALLAGVGAAWLTRVRGGVLVVIVLAGLVTRTAWTVAFPIDVPIVPSPGLAGAPDYLRPTAAAPAIYRFARTLPASAVLVELPFGDIAYEIRYTYFTLAHDHRTLNGYSGVLPPSFLSRQSVLTQPLADLDASWTALAPASHVIVHTGAWLDDTGTRLRDWLGAHGARAVTHVDGAWLYEVPPR